MDADNQFTTLNQCGFVDAAEWRCGSGMGGCIGCSRVEELHGLRRYGGGGVDCVLRCCGGALGFEGGRGLRISEESAAWTDGGEVDKALFSSPRNTKSFQDSPSHRILRHMHEALNIDENKN